MSTIKQTKAFSTFQNFSIALHTPSKECHIKSVTEPSFLASDHASKEVVIQNIISQEQKSLCLKDTWLHALALKVRWLSWSKVDLIACYFLMASPEICYKQNTIFSKHSENLLYCRITLKSVCYVEVNRDTSAFEKTPYLHCITIHCQHSDFFTACYFNNVMLVCICIY